jgi:uncharacterized lipoprotein
MVAFATFLTACASNNDLVTNSGYRSARAQATLEIPPDLVHSTTDKIKQPVLGEGSNLVLPDIQGLELQGSGLQRFLRVDANAEQTWARLVDFTSVRNLPILTESKRDGIIETDWIGDDTANTNIMTKLRNVLGGVIGRKPINDKYKFWLDRLDQNTTAIHVGHSKLIQRVIEPKRSYETTVIRWEETPGVEFKIIAMLRNLKTYFGGGAVDVAIDSVQLFMDDAEYIALTQPFEQAWKSVGSAIVGTEYRLVDIKQEKDLYVIKQAKKQGLIAKVTYKRKLGIKVEAIGASNSRITITTSRGRGIDREDALPVLYALTSELRKQ